MVPPGPGPGGPWGAFSAHFAALRGYFPSPPPPPDFPPIPLSWGAALWGAPLVQLTLVVLAHEIPKEPWGPWGALGGSGGALGEPWGALGTLGALGPS